MSPREEYLSRTAMYVAFGKRSGDWAGDKPAPEVEGAEYDGEWLELFGTARETLEEGVRKSVLDGNSVENYEWIHRKLRELSQYAEDSEVLSPKSYQILLLRLKKL